MPLIDLKTDLKSLRFKSSDTPGDRPGGGWSYQPFVTKNPNYLDNVSIEDLRRTGGKDMLLRGGTLLPLSIFEDEERLSKFLFTTPAGLNFTTQQNLLSATGVRVFGGYPNQVRAANINKANDGTYLPTSTLAAVAGTALGIHPNKQGIDPTGKNDLLSRPQYLNLVNGGVYNTGNFEGIAKAANNRLFNLYSNKIVGLPISALTFQSGPAGTGPLAQFLLNNKLIRGVSNFVSKNTGNPENLYAYLAGPQATQGPAGKTIIKIGGDSPSRQYGGDVLVGNNIFTSYRASQNSALKFSTLSQSQLATYPVIGDGSTYNTVTDFRDSLNAKPSSFIAKSLPYEKYNIEQRVNLGDPGRRTVNRSNPSKGIPSNAKGLDQINSMYLYQSDFVTTDKRKNDLIKFRIATILNDNPSQSIFTHFRAYINSFTDSMNASWNSFKYSGRGEDFYTYQGFQNNIQLSFTVVAQSIQELSIMFQKLNYLKSTLAPDYSDSGYMRGNIHKLTMGAYFYEVPGIIDSLQYTIPNDTPWDIAIPSQKSGIQDELLGGINIRTPKVKELPHRIEVTMTFRPIYDFLPETVKDIEARGADMTQRFITLQDSISKTSDNLYSDEISDDFRVNGINTQAAKVTTAEPVSPTQNQDPPPIFGPPRPPENNFTADLSGLGQPFGGNRQLQELFGNE